MAKGLEKKYYKLSENEFSKLLNNIRNHPQTIHFFHNTDTPFFFLLDNAASECFLQLHKDQLEFDEIFNRFSAFGRKQLVQSFLIREVESTNGIENVHSTRHDIFKLIQSKKNNGEKKLVSIVNGYQILLNELMDPPADLSGLRYLYDQTLKGAIEKEDRPDGEYFRKKAVYITNGLRNVHQGFYPEKAVNEGMQEFLDLLNDSKKDLFERLILSHFLLETIHPFYDGNGRFGRFLFTQKYFNETRSYLAFGVSTAFNRRKKQYYKALDEARHEHMYGSLNTYVEDIVDIIHSYNQELMSELKEKKSKIDMLTFPEKTFTRCEREILKLMAESSLLTDFGISNAEIMEYTGISKRTVISSMNKFREMNLLDETKFSKTVYHRLHNV